MIYYFVKIIFIRSYKYLLLTFFSLLVGAFLFGAILSLSKSLSSFFTTQGKTLLGGDIVLKSSNKIDTANELFAGLIKKDYILTAEYDVQAVFRNTTGSSTISTNIRFVGKDFPLYGKISVEDNVPFLVGHNIIYAERPFLKKLGISLGDNVFIGTSSYKVAGVLLKEPDKVSLGVSFSPTVIISQDDILTSGINLSQSRVSYKISIKENEILPLTKETIDSIKTFAKDNKLRFDDARDGPNNLVEGLSSVQDFAGIILAIALFLVAVNIGANLTYILARFKKTIALLKTFGATTLQIQCIYSIILGTLGITAGALGTFLGAFGTTMFLPTLSLYIEGIIPSTAIIPIVILGGCSGFILIIISSIPFFNSLKYINPKQLLSNISTTTNKKIITNILTYSPIPLFLGILLYGISKDIQLTLYSVLGLILLFSFFMLISYGVVTYLYNNRRYFSFMFSSIISFLKWRGIETIITSASIMTALAGVFIVSAVEQNIMYNLHGTISKSTPALYLVDITTSQLPKVKEIAGSTFKEYPIIRGRLLTINDRDITMSKDREVTRELNMTYRDTLIDGEIVSSGVWHGADSSKQSVSFEKSFAKEAGGVEVGDMVSVFVQGIIITAKVTSIHEADKARGTPYFYMVFSPDVLATFPASYFGTVDVNKETVEEIETKIGNLYPNIIPLGTSTILETINTLLTSIILVVKIIGIPSILLGLMLVLVMTGQSLYERKGDVLVLRVYGLTRMTITFLFVAETAVLILIATFISYLVAHGVAFILNTYLFSFKLFTFAITPLYITIGILVVTSTFSYYIAYSLTKTPLKKLLSEK